MALFKRKKKESMTSFLPLNIEAVFSSFGTNILNSDTVRIAIDRIASHASKLKPRHIKSNKEALVESDSEINYLLKNSPNLLMNPTTFLYRIVSLLFINNNCFISSSKSSTLKLKKPEIDNFKSKDFSIFSSINTVKSTL